MKDEVVEMIVVLQQEYFSSKIRLFRPTDSQRTGGAYGHDTSRHNVPQWVHALTRTLFWPSSAERLEH